MESWIGEHYYSLVMIMEVVRYAYYTAFAVTMGIAALLLSRILKVVIEIRGEIGGSKGFSKGSRVRVGENASPLPW